MNSARGLSALFMTPNVQLFWGLHGYEAIEVERWSSQWELEKDGHGMREHLPNKAMLKMPPIMDAKAGHRKALGQLRAHGFNALAQTGADLQEGRTMGRRHPFARGGDHEDAMPVRQQSLAKGLDKAFIGGHQPGKPGAQIVQQLEVMGPGGQEGTTGDQPAARDAQPQLEARGVQLLGGTGAISGKRLEAAVAATAGVATDGQGQGIEDLDGVGGLPTDLRQPLRDGGFDLPEGGGLTDKERARLQVRTEVRVVGAEVRQEVLVGGQLKLLAADLQGEDFFSAQRRGKPAPAQGVGVFDHTVVLTDQTVHSKDKRSAIHWGASCGE